MEEGKAHVGTTIFFAAGVAAASYSLRIFYIGTQATASFSFLSLCLTLALCIVMWRKVTSGAAFSTGVLPIIFLTFFIAGVSASLTSSIPHIGRVDNQGNFFIRCADILKRLIDSLPFSQSSSNALAKAFLTGDQSSLTRQVRDAFRCSGASHLLALSGMHLSIIYLVVSKVLSVLGNTPPMKWLRSITIIAGSAFFTVMTGAVPSLVRAFLFILLRECACLTCRRRDNLVIFCNALMIQLAITPQAVTSVGFQLSYLAMLGIFLLYKPLDSLWEKASGGDGDSSQEEESSIIGSAIATTMRKIWSMCALSISCQVFTGPAVMAYFGTFPQYFLITNLLCIPLSNAIMVLTLVILPLQALGICPQFLIAADDFLLRLIIRILELISMI